MSERAETDVTLPQANPAERLEVLERGTTTATALALFDSLPAVELGEMIGSWRGRGVPTGHPMDGMLELFGWHGKRFDSIDDAHPLVFADGRGDLFSAKPALLPVGLLTRAPALVNSPISARVFRLLRPLLRTRKPAARLRMTQYRGVLTATMIYDAQPINDAFRRIDDDTVLGVMDLRGLDRPFVFSLRRERLAAA
jgi:hypothetical protein